MWMLKGCPRCGGDTYVEKDMFGRCERCLQCGHIRDLEVMVEVKAEEMVSLRETRPSRRRSRSRALPALRVHR